MAARYVGGATVGELAEEFACDRQTAARRLKAHGVPMRNRPPSDEEVRRFVQLYGSGLSLAKVATETDFSEKTIMTYLRKQGVRLRDTHGREREPAGSVRPRN